MSYLEQGIEALSKSQIGKLLNGHSVRIKHGIEHAIKLSEEHSKKLRRAGMKGKGITIQLDPYAIEHNQHLRHGGSLSYDKFANNPNVKRIASAATDRAVKEIGGSLSYDKFANNPNVKRIAAAATDRAVKGIAGGAVNRINKFNRWTGALGGVYQGIAHAVKPVAQPVFGAMSDSAVGYINPTPQQQLMDSLMGEGVKKNRGRPRKNGGALVSAGY